MRIRALNHQVAPTAVNCPHLPPNPLKHSGLLPSLQSQTSLRALGRLRLVINTSSAQSSCCYCHTAKFGPHAQSLRLQANQLNQHSLIPASQDSFIKGLAAVSSCFFSQPDHFPRSHVTQWRIFPHLSENFRGRQMPSLGRSCNRGQIHMDDTLEWQSCANKV